MSLLLSPFELFLVLSGPFVGSWLATLAVSWPQWPEASLLRSACGRCAHPLPAWRMIPLVSFAIQRGRCAYCRAPISPVHPALEAACLFGASIAVLATDGGQAAGGAMLSWLLAYAAAVDERALEIPDWSSLALAMAGLVLAAGQGLPALAQAFAGALIVGAVLGGVHLLWRRLAGREGLGAGDVKLAAACAVWTGPVLAAPAIALAGLATLARIAVQPELRRPGARIAFGPGLGAGFFAIWAANAAYGP